MIVKRAGFEDAIEVPGCYESAQEVWDVEWSMQDARDRMKVLKAYHVFMTEIVGKYLTEQQISKLTNVMQRVQQTMKQQSEILAARKVKR